MPIEARYHEQVSLLVSLLPFFKPSRASPSRAARPSTSSCSHYLVYRSTSTWPTCRWSPVTRRCDAVVRRCSGSQSPSALGCQAYAPSFRIIAETS